MTNLFRKLKKWLYGPLLPAIVAAVIAILAMWGMPLFSDATFHANVARDIMRHGFFPVESPVGWMAVDLNPIGQPPYLTHPPLFYLALAALGLTGWGMMSALSIISVTCTALGAILLYLLLKDFFNKSTAWVGALFYAVMPMNIWLNSHRIMEPVQYLMSIACFLYAKRFIDTKRIPSLLLSAIFAAAILYLKITSLFVVLAVMIFMLWAKAGMKMMVVFASIIAALYLPYTIFSVATRGTIAYAPPGFPIIDSKIFDPWWSKPKQGLDAIIEKESGNKDLDQKLRFMDRNKRQYINDVVEKGDIPGALQNYAVLPVAPSANAHWYSPINTLAMFDLVLFSAGLIIYIRYYRGSKFHYILIPLAVPITYYLTKTAEIRYFYTLPILLIAFFALSVVYLRKWFTSRALKYTLLAVLGMQLAIVDLAEADHSYAYKNSLLHNISKSDGGAQEFPKLGPSVNLDKSEIIFTPAAAEVSYYFDRRTVWDYRLFFVSEERVKQYMDEYRIKTIIVPTYMMTDSFYSYVNKQEETNNKANWEGNSVPQDSNFYRLINDDKQFKMVADFPSFKIFQKI